ncbi:MAG: HEAT repeat domain-containing protein [Candidatus Hermodarchaeota archaeon]
MLKTKINPKEIFERNKEFGVKNSASMLTEIIETDADNNKRKEAIKYLALISQDVSELQNDCYETFESLLISEEIIIIKCEAAKAIGKLKHEKGLKPLNWILEQKQVDNQIKLSVLKAIQQIRFQDPEVQLYIKELDCKDKSIRDYVTTQLLSLNPEYLVDVLLNSLKKKQFSNKHKTELIKLIGYELSSINLSYGDLSYIKAKYPNILSKLIRDKSILLNVITHILKEEDLDLLNSIITILELIREEIENALIKLLLLDDFIVKKNAIILSGKLKLKNAVDLLIINLDNIYNEVSIASIEALGEIGDISAVPELLDILDIEDISFEYTDLDMKLYIMDAIKRIYSSNQDASYDYLYTSLKKNNNTIRESVAFILGEIGKPEFVQPLIDLLDVRNLDVRKNTIIALGKIGDLDSIHKLINILEDDSSYWLIKKVAVDAIFNIVQNNWYRIKDDENEIKRLMNMQIARLIEHLGNKPDEDFKVKIGLIKILENYGDQHAISALIKRVNDFHRVVRIRVSNAIKKIEERLELEKGN